MGQNTELEETKWSRTRSNIGKRARLRTLADGMDEIILIRKRPRQHTQIWWRIS